MAATELFEFLPIKLIPRVQEKGILRYIMDPRVQDKSLKDHVSNLNYAIGKFSRGSHELMILRTLKHSIIEARVAQLKLLYKQIGYQLALIDVWNTSDLYKKILRGRYLHRHRS